MSTTTSVITCDGLIVNGTIAATGAQSSGAITATSIAVGSGTVMTQFKKGIIAVTVAASAAAAEEDIQVTITGAAAGDMIFLTPLDAAMEAGVAIVAVWVSAADTVKIRITNVHTSSLGGTTANWQYMLVKS